MVIVTLTVSDTNLQLSEGSSFFVNIQDEYDIHDFLDFKKDLSHILKYSIKEYENEEKVQK